MIVELEAFIYGGDSGQKDWIEGRMQHERISIIAW